MGFRSTLLVNFLLFVMSSAYTTNKWIATLFQYARWIAWIPSRQVLYLERHRRAVELECGWIRHPPSPSLTRPRYWSIWALPRGAALSSRTG
ncbi:hypothetical protein V8D89_007537 [Ganoderma adspersum]